MASPKNGERDAIMPSPADTADIPTSGDKRPSKPNPFCEAGAAVGAAAAGAALTESGAAAGAAFRDPSSANDIADVPIPACGAGAPLVISGGRASAGEGRGRGIGTSSPRGGA